MAALHEVRFTRQALKDLKKLPSKLQEKVKRLCLEVLSRSPYEGKRLIGELQGSYSLRLSYHDRLVYSLDERSRIVYIERCRTHYGD